MNRFVRYLVMWLLIVALPVQGLAASTMLFCGPGHHGAPKTTDSGHDHASHLHMGASEVSATSQGAAHPDAVEAAPPHDGSSFSPASVKHVKHANVPGKCSACAACCTVAFLPTAIIAFTEPAPSRALAVVEPVAHVGFFTDGPDRPPRIPLA